MAQIANYTSTGSDESSGGTLPGHVTAAIIAGFLFFLIVIVTLYTFARFTRIKAHFTARRNANRIDVQDVDGPRSPAPSAVQPPGSMALKRIVTDPVMLGVPCLLHDGTTGTPSTASPSTPTSSPSTAPCPMGLLKSKANVATTDNIGAGCH